METIIETQRLRLRKITFEDKDVMFRLYSDPEILRYTGEPLTKSVEEMERAITARIKSYEDEGFGRWATILKENNQFIGWAGLKYLPEFDEIDVGYRFFQEYWGKGIATEASRAVLDYGFNQLGIEKIIAIAMKENKASIRVMQKIGMEFDKYAPYEEGAEDAVWYTCDRERFSS